MKIFVYGTLKRAYSNEYARFLHSNSTYLGEATVIGRLYLLDWYPGLVLDESGYKVHGEVFDVKHNIREVTEMLDDYEGVDEGLYVKKETLVLLNNKKQKVFFYESLHVSDVELKSGVFEE